MAFHLEDDALAVTDVHDTCVFTGAADDLWTFRREGAQPFFGRLIRTMLVPHRRKYTEFGERGFTPNNFQDARVLGI